MLGADTQEKFKNAELAGRTGMGSIQKNDSLECRNCHELNIWIFQNRGKKQCEQPQQLCFRRKNL